MDGFLKVQTYSNLDTAKVLKTVCRKGGQLWSSEQNVKILDHAFSDPVSSEQDDDEYTAYKSNTDVHSQPIMIPMKLNDSKVHLELDTGASVSVISEQTWKNYLNSVPLQDSGVTLKTYSGERLEVLGQTDISVEYHNQVTKLPVYVLRGKGPDLTRCPNWALSR